MNLALTYIKKFHIRTHVYALSQHAKIRVQEECQNFETIVSCYTDCLTGVRLIYDHEYLEKNVR